MKTDLNMIPVEFIEYEDFLEWLADHNYCKVVPCEQCYFWGNYHGNTGYEVYEKKINRCRYHKIDTWSDDHCCWAVVLKGGNNAGEIR